MQKSHRKSVSQSLKWELGVFLKAVSVGAEGAKDEDMVIKEDAQPSAPYRRCHVGVYISVTGSHQRIVNKGMM